MGDRGSIPVSGRSPGEGNGNPLHILAWKIPWIEEPSRLQSMESQSRTRLSNNTHTHTQSLWLGENFQLPFGEKKKVNATLPTAALDRSKL